MYRFASLKKLLSLASKNKEEMDIIDPYISENVSDSVIDKVIDLWAFADNSMGSLTRVKERAAQLGFGWAGSGAYRFVVEISPSLVAKIQYNREGYMMNEEEYTHQDLFIDHFPRVYGHGKGAEGDGFGWLIMEKVNVISPDDAKEMLKWFPELSQDMLTLQDYYGISLALDGVDEFDAFVMLLDPCIKGGDIEGHMDEFSIYKNKTFISICTAIAAIDGVDVGDLRGGNLGWSGNRFLIIDSSL